MGVILLFTGCLMLLAGMGVVDGGNLVPGVCVALAGLCTMGIGTLLEGGR